MLLKNEKFCVKITHGQVKNMFSKKKMINIFCISAILAVAIFVSFFNLVNESGGNATFIATFAFVTVIAVAELGAYFLKNKTVSFFIFGYLTFFALCFLIPTVFLALGGKYNAFVAVCSIILSPLYGFMSVSEFWGIISAVVLAVLEAVSALLSFDLIKRK